MRPSNYPHTDIFLIVFCKSSRESFENVLIEWEPGTHFRFYFWWKLRSLFNFEK